MYYFGYCIASPDGRGTENFNSIKNDSYELKKIKEFTKKILNNIPFIDDPKYKRSSFPPLKQIAYLEFYIFLYFLTDFIFVEKNKSEKERRNFYDEINKFLFECGDWNFTYKKDTLIEIFDSRLKLYAKILQKQNLTIDENFYSVCFSFQSKLFTKELIDKKYCIIDYNEILELEEVKPTYLYCLSFLGKIKHHILAFIGELDGINTEENKANFILSLQKLNGSEKYKKLKQVLDRVDIEDILNAYSVKLKDNNKVIRSQFVFDSKNSYAISRMIHVLSQRENIDYQNNDAKELLYKNDFYNYIDFSTINENYEELLFFIQLIEDFKNIRFFIDIIFEPEEVERFKQKLTQYPCYNEQFINQSYPFISKTENDLFIGYFEEDYNNVNYVIKRIKFDAGPENITSCNIDISKKCLSHFFID